MNDSTHGIRNLDVFFTVSFGQFFDEVVLELVLVFKACGVNQYVELDAGFPEGMEKNLGQNLAGFLGIGHDLTGNLQRDILDFLQVAVVGNADGNFDCDVLLGQVVIRDDGAGNIFVRDYDEVSHDGLNRGVTPCDVCYESLFAAAQHDVIIQAKLLGNDEMKPGENVGESFLHTKGNTHAANAESREDRGNGNSPILKDNNHAHRIYDEGEDVVEQAGFWHSCIGTFHVQRDHAGERSGNHTGNGIDIDGEKQVGKDFRDTWCDVNRVHNPVQAGNHAERNGDTLYGMDENIF